MHPLDASTDIPNIFDIATIKRMIDREITKKDITTINIWLVNKLSITLMEINNPAFCHPMVNATIIKTIDIKGLLRTQGLLTLVG